MFARIVAPLALAVTSVFAATAADAAINISVRQSGNDVVMTASGTFDTSTATSLRQGSSFATWTRPWVGMMTFAGSASYRNTVYALTPTDRHFGTDTPGDFMADSTSGTLLQVALTWGELVLPTAYVSGSAIASEAVYRNRTVAGMRYVAGTYTGTAGSNVVTVTVEDAAVAAVPEPSTWALMLAGFGLVGAGARSRRRSAAPVAA